MTHAPLTWPQRWLRAAALIHSVLIRRLRDDDLDRAAEEIARLLPWEDRRLMLAVLVGASAGADRAALLDWLAQAEAAVAHGPAAPFDGPLRAEAESFAAMASETEVKIWLMALVGRLPGAERLRFAAALQRQAVGAVAS